MSTLTLQPPCLSIPSKTEEATGATIASRCIPPTPPEEASPSEESADRFQRASLDDDDLKVPSTQQVLLLDAPRTPYRVAEGYAVPELRLEDEMLIRVEAVGLNPIDWKAADFNFGIPHLPYIAGRDYIGTVLIPPQRPSQRSFPPGSRILATSTAYRDPRTSAFQSYAIAHPHTISRLPASLSPPTAAAAIGVAYVAAALTLGVCFGVNFSRSHPTGPNLLPLLHRTPPAAIPADVRSEALGEGLGADRPRPGEWVAVWGGSSTTAGYVAQLARLAGLRVVLLLDLGKHGGLLGGKGEDGVVLVDSADPGRAGRVLEALTGGQGVRWVVDTVGVQGVEGGMAEGGRRHLVGLSGLPKRGLEGVVCHTVPIKLFHEVAEVGEALMEWLERLLEGNWLRMAEVEVLEGGLGRVNDGLDRMRRGEVSRRRVVVDGVAA